MPVVLDKIALRNWEHICPGKTEKTMLPNTIALKDSTSERKKKWMMRITVAVRDGVSIREIPVDFCPMCGENLVQYLEKRDENFWV